MQLEGLPKHLPICASASRVDGECACQDVAERLQTVNPQLYGQVRHVLEVNKAQRHIRGGQATRRKYRGNT